MEKGFNLPKIELYSMKKFKPKPQNIKIFVQAYVGQQLMDKRKGRNGLVFGIIPDITRQYGIEFKEQENGFIFIGPTSRMQLLVEKLHFAGVNYWEL